MRILIIGLFLLGYQGSTLARTPAPAPPPGSPENTIFAPDRLLPSLSGTGAFPDNALFPTIAGPPTAADSQRPADAGGDDVQLGTVPGLFEGNDLAVDSAGHLYAVFTSIEMVYRDFRVYRSTDGGTTWETWATFSDPGQDTYYFHPVLHIAEGSQDRIFLAYKKSLGGGTEINVAWSSLSGAADFTSTALDTITHTTYGLDITSDATAFSSYYLYVVYDKLSSDRSEILFARSLDLGENWETPYSIATLGSFDPQYIQPHIAYGYGRYVHVAWTYNTAQDPYDAAVRYRRAPDFAGGGQAAWEPIQALTSATNGAREFASSVHASASTEQVMIGYLWRTDPGCGVVGSQNQGENWSAPHVFPGEMESLLDVVQDPASLDWYVDGILDGEAGYLRAPAADLTAWSDHVSLADSTTTVAPRLVLDPVHQSRPAMVWAHRLVDESWQLLFDGDWRGDEGFPNHEDGFPLDLVATPISDPALHDLDGDGDLEIIFADAYGFVQVYRPDGTVPPGWPRYTGASLSDSPVAVADMNGDGIPTILAPSADGRVFGYDPDGGTADGWPFDSGEDAFASVNIGHLGGPYPQVAVVIAGSKMHFLNYQARQVPGSHVWNNDSLKRGCAIGDHDDDGVNEVVFRAGQLLLATEMTMSYTDLYRGLGSEENSLPALGDLDLDGNLEIVITTPGLVHVIDDGGADFPGWPQVFDDGVRLSDPAIAHIFGGFDREIAVCSRNWKAALFEQDGSLVGDYPVATDEHWYVYGNPILGTVTGSPEVIFGARGSRGYAYSNLGELNDGWPKLFTNHCELTPAMGDMDQDGRNEIAFLTRDQLVVVDVGAAPWDDAYTWLMSGHDARRTGCADCPEDLASPVPDDPDAITRVSLAPPSPNPISGQATFHFAVPVQAVVELSVYDLRGHRLALIDREEVVPGRHQMTWNGRDDQGRPLASGNYLATLRVQGPGVNERINRKVTVLH